MIEHAAILVHEQNAKADQVEQGGEALTLVIAAQQVVLTQGLRPTQLRHRLEQRVFGLLARTDVLRRQTQPPFSLPFPFPFPAPGTTTPMRGHPHGAPVPGRKAELEVLRQPVGKHLADHPPAEIAIGFEHQQRERILGGHAGGRGETGHALDRGADPAQAQAWVENRLDAMDAFGDFPQQIGFAALRRLAAPLHSVLTNTLDRRWKLYSSRFCRGRASGPISLKPRSRNQCAVRVVSTNRRSRR